MKTYVTFGQGHAHHVGGNTFDPSCIAVVEGDRETVFELFGPKFCFEYSEEEWKIFLGRTSEEDLIRYYPRGYINANF